MNFCIFSHDSKILHLHFTNLQTKKEKTSTIFIMQIIIPKEDKQKQQQHPNTVNEYVK